MKKKLGIKIGIILAANIILAIAIALPYAWSQEYAQSEILVKFKAPTNKAEAKSACHLRWKMDAKEIRKFVINNVRQLKLPADKTVEQAILEAYQDPDVLYAEPNYVVRANQIPNDPMYNQLWGMEKIQIPQAWDLATGSNQIIIAIIDTGVDYHHPDLAANMWTGPNGEYGYDFHNNDSDPVDDNGHGTHVAGTIGAVANNNIGVAGACWNVKIMALKFLGGDGLGYISDAISAIEYATQNDAHILNNSWGGGGYSQAMVDAITASNDAGTLFTASAGNDGTNNDIYPHYPSNYDVPNVIAVAASDQNDNLVSLSCYGQTSVDLAAPGISILSTIPGNQYDSYSGTSMAAPHVSGVCGLIWTQNPSWTNAQVKEKLLQSVDLVSSLQGKVLTGGRLNAYKALGGGTPPSDPSDPSQPPDPPSINVVFYDDMESGTNGWTQEGSNSLWHQSHYRYSSSNTAWYYGREDTRNYDTGGLNFGSLYSPAISLKNTSATECTLTFNYWREVESYAESYDVTSLVISKDQGSTWENLWWKDSTNPSTSTWEKETISLNNYIGYDIILAFTFNTIDEYINNYEGWYIDDVKITTSGGSEPPPAKQPNIEIVPSSIPDVQVQKDGTLTQTIKIKNTGESELTYSIANQSTSATSEIHPYEPCMEEESQANTLTINNTAKQSFRAAKQSLGTNWQVILNKKTGTVHRAYGGSIKLLGLSSENMDKVRLEHLSRDFIAQHYNLLKAEEKNLKLIRNEKHSHQWYVTFQQTYNDVPVYDAKVELRYSAKTGQLILFGSDAYPDIDVSTTPSITAETAQEIAKDNAGFNETEDQLRSTQLIIFPIEHQENMEYYLAYKVILFTEFPPHLWIYIINAIDGSIITKWDGIRHDSSGVAEQSSASEINGMIRGKVHPFYPSDSQILEEFAYEKINVSGANSSYTDKNGYYKTPVSDSDNHTVTTAFSGLYLYTINQNGPDASYSGSANSGTPHNIQWEDSNSDVTERDCYYHTQVAYLKIKEIDPDFTGVDYCAPAKINIPNYSNAYFDGYGYGYGEGGPKDWPNLGQTSEVMYHEYGHGIMHFQYNQNNGSSSEFGAMHEGFADYFACIITNEPLIGEERGPGYPVLRDLDREPEATPSNTSPQSHDRGQVVSGALWDLRKELGAEFTDHLFHFARYGHSQNFNDYYIDILLEDDDDGNYNNGTPHSEEIYSAFAAHDIAYVTPSDPNDNTAPAAVINLTAINSTYNTITLQWTAPGDDGNSGQAHSYDIRYSTSQITDSSWNQANQLAGEPYPKKGGEIENVTVSGLNPDTTYYLALKTRDNKGNWSSLSNITSRKTGSAVNIYTNDMEGDTSGWTTNSTWEVVNTNAHSGTYCWTDSPNKNYENNTNCSLISPSFNLATSTNTSLNFWHKYSLENDYDICYVEISANNGTSWEVVKSFNGQNTNWTNTTIDMSAYDGKDNMKIRFRLYSNFTSTSDGWYIDDVKIMAGTYTPEWLTATPASGTIQAGAEEIITLSYDATGLGLGIHTTTLNITSNDPDTPKIELSVNMEVLADGTDLPPSQPTGLETTAGDTQVELTWNANTESDIAGYNIYRKVANGSTATRITGKLVCDTEAKLNESLTLVKVFLTEESNIDSLLNLGIAVYANMGIYAIAEVTYGELDELSLNGFTYKVLDTDSQAKQYYIAWTPIEENLAIIHDYATVVDKFPRALLAQSQATLYEGGKKPELGVLEEDTNTAIIYTDQDTAKQIHQLGFKLIPIKRRPLLLGEKTVVSYSLSQANTPKQDLIKEMVSKVQEPGVRNYIQTLQDFGTRYIWTNAYDQSAEYALNEFQNMGLDAEYHQFHLLGDNTIIKNNVVATLTGTSKPDEIFIICAHLDSTTAALDSGGGDESNAPGAEDNASGSAVVLEAARILSQYEFDSTIKFILFGAEEEWFEGSETYVNEMADSGANIAGAFNLEMIAYLDTPDWDLTIVSHPGWQDLPNTIVQAANTYTDIQAYNFVDGSASWSDHWYFWQRGYPAVAAIEYMSSHFYPWYHSTEDTIDKISTPFAAEVAKLGVSTLAELANPIISPAPVPVYEKINDALITTADYKDTNVTNDITYLYVVTAADNAGNESIYSNEVSATPKYNDMPPSAPAGLKAAAGDTQVELTWNANTESNIAGYNIYRKEGYSSTATRITGKLVCDIEAKMDESLTLVKVFLTGVAEQSEAPLTIDSLITLGIAVYENWGTCAIAEVTDSELGKLTDNGFTYKILDTDSQTKQYYAVWAPTQEKLGTISQHAEVLDVEPNSAIIHTDKASAIQIPQLGFQIRPIRKRPLLLGEKTVVSYALSLADTPKQTLIKEMVSKVQEPSVHNYLQALQDFGTRYTYTNNYDQSAEYAFSEFQNMGLDVEYHQFTIYGGSYKNNVVATLTGKTNPDEIFIICGHLDSISNDPWNAAPGAEDNASGSVMAMEAARILSQYEFDSTIKFILFGGEEEGLHGSDAYVYEMANNGANIAGALNFDMIAYLDTPNKDLWIGSHSSWQELAQAVVQAANTYTDIQAYNIVNDGISWSDHWPFWQKGYPAIFAIELDTDHFYPWYHQTTDTIDKISTSFAAEVAKLGISTLAELANPIYNVYEKINNTLITSTGYIDTAVTNGTKYLYVVTAVDINNKESSYSNEASATPKDIIPPDIKITSPANNDIFEVGSLITVSGTVDDNNATVTVNNKSAAVSNGTFSVSGISITEGTNTITAVAKDTTGNTSSTSITVTGIDTIPPEAPTIDAVTNPANTNSQTISGTKTTDTTQIIVSCPTATVGEVTYGGVDTNGLVAHWKMDEESDTRSDSSGNNNHLLDVNSVGYSTGHDGNATDFNPSNKQYLYIPNENQTGLHIPGDITVACWINLKSNDGANDIIARYSIGNTISIDYFFYAEGGNARLKLWSGPSYTQSNDPVPVGSWHHVAFTRTGDYVTFYIDSGSSGTFYLPTVAPVQDAVVLVGKHGATSYTDIKLDELCIWNRALSGEEISDLYNDTGSSNTWSCKLTALTEGDNNISVIAKDKAGNESNSATATIKLDTTAPVVAITSPADNSTVVTTTVNVSGTIDDNNATVTVNGKSAEVTNNTFTATGISLQEGSNTITATTVDTAGNQSSAASITIIRDTTPPAISITSPSNNSTVGTTTVNVSGTIDDSQATVVVNGKSAEVNGNTFSVTGISLVEGINTITLVSTDTVGNQSSTSIIIVRDTTAPVVGISSPANNSTVNTTAITVSGSVDDSEASVAVNGKSAVVSGSTFTVSGISLNNEGSNTITATATDSVGNSGTTSITVILDTTAPAISITSPNDGDTVGKPAITVSGTIDDNNATVAVNGVSASVASGSFSADGIGLEEGGNTITAIAADTAGNAATHSITIIYDPSLKVITITSPADGFLTNQNTIDVSGTIDDPDITGVGVNGVISTISNGIFTSVDVPLQEGTNTVTATASISDPSANNTHSISVVSDTTPPGAPAIDPATNPTNINTQTITGTITDVDDTEQIIVSCPTATVGEVTYGGVDTNGLVAYWKMDEESGTRSDSSGNNNHLLDVNSVGYSTGHDSNAADFNPSNKQYLYIPSANQTGLHIPGDMTVACWINLKSNNAASDIIARYSIGNTISIDYFLYAEGGNARLKLWSGPSYTQSNDPVPVGSWHHVAFTRSGDSVTFYIDSVSNGTFNLSTNAPVENAPVLVGKHGASSYTDIKLDELCLWNRALSDQEIIDLYNNTGGNDLWSCKLTDLTEGNNNISITAKDKAGNESNSATATIKLDTTAPVVAITSPSDNSKTNKTSIAVTGTVSDTHLDSASVNGIDAVINNNSFTADNIPLTAGYNTITAKALDSLGNESTASITVTYDPNYVGLQITSPEDGSKTTSSPINVSGTISNFEAVSIKVNNIDAVISNNTFTASNISLTEGSNTITAIAADSNGETLSNSITVMLDTTAPVISITSPANGSLTNNSKITVIGSIDDNNASVIVNGASASISNNIFTASDISLSEGLNTITVTATDTAGNSTSKSCSVTLDPTAPVISITSHTNNAVLGSIPITVSGTINDNQAQVVVNGKTTVVSNGTFSVAGVSLQEGSNDITATATDPAGNTGTHNISLTLDTTPPVISVSSPQDGAVVGSTPITVTGTINESNSTVTVNGTPASVSDNSFTSSSIDLVEGPNTITIVAADSVGNSSSLSITVGLDTSFPVATISSPSDGDVLNTPIISVSGSINDNNASVTVNGKTTTVSNNTFTAADIILVEGANTIEAVATDEVGNSTSTSITVTLDTTAPVITITSPQDGSLTNSSSISVSGSTDDNNASVAVTVNSVSAVVSSGTFTASNVGLSEGENTVTATATDTAGNSAQAQITITLDTAPPSAPTIDPVTSPTNVNTQTITGTITDVDDTDQIVVSCSTATVGEVTYGGVDTNGLVAYWKMDEASGTRSDSSGNTNHLLDVNSVGYSTGHDGNAADFVPSNKQYLYIPSATGLHIPGDITIACWINLKSNKDVANDIIARYPEGNPFYIDYFFYTKGGNNRLKLWSGSSYAESNGSVPVGSWHHVAFTRSGDYVTFYIDSESSGTFYLPTGTTVQDAVVFVGKHGANAYTDTKLDELCIWNRALSSEKISDLYNDTGSSNTWSCELTGLTEGNNNISVTAKDKAGNTSGAATASIEYINPNSSSDSDSDGIYDTFDAFPDDPSEWEDTDSDGIGNNADTDDDNDGVLDIDDDFPYDPAKSQAKHTFIISASMPTTWDTENAQKSYENNLDVLDIVNPCWYELEADGTFTCDETDENVINNILTKASDNNILVIPYLNNYDDDTASFDPARVSTVINDANLTITHIQNIVNEVTSQGYDGINIDYESCYADDRDAFTVFIKNLAAALHTEGKILEVSVHAKTYEPGDWNGNQSQDWEALGQVADYFRIMTYDYHCSTCPPGPIAPVDWLDDVTTFALTLVDSKKLVMGVPFYGYDWVGKNGADKTYLEVQDIISTYNITPNWDSSAQELYFEYYDGNDHTVYYQTSESVSYKLDLFSYYNVKGISIYRIGSEDPSNWGVIRTLLGIAPTDLKITCLGDSITHGYPYIFEDTENTYPAQLEILLEAAYGSNNCHVENHGISGATADQVLIAMQYLNWMDEDPDIVLLKVGGNDLQGADPSNISEVIAQTTAEVQAIIDLVIAHTNADGSHPQIIVSTFTPVQDSWKTLGVKLYNNSLENNLTGMDLLITTNWEDFYDSSTGQAYPSLMSDEVHPNAEGYGVMAENWFEAIKLKIKPNPPPNDNTGETYYVSTSGNDSNPGSIDQPWSSPIYGATQLQPGDTLTIREGTYYLPGQWDGRIAPNSGSSEKWVTVKAADGEKVTITGSTDAFYWSAIQLEDCSYVKLQGLEIKNIGISDIRMGIYIDNCSHIELKDITINYVTHQAVKILTSSDILIDSCDFSNTGMGGIDCGVKNEGEYGVSNLTIKNTHLDENGWYGPYAADWADGLAIETGGGNILIKNCTAIHNRADGFDSKTENTIVGRCTALNNLHNQIKLWADNALIANCIAANTSPDSGYWDCIVFEGTSGDTYALYNSVIYGSQNYAMIAGYDHPGTDAYFEVKNCIFANNHGGAYFQSSANVLEKHNIYHDSESGEELYKNGISYTSTDINNGLSGPTNKSLDPLFTDAGNNDFTLQSSSPAIDAGTTIDFITTDITGTSRPQGDGYDIGPYESSSSGGTEGDLEAYISFIKSHIPGKNSESYIDPTSAEWTIFQEIITYILNQQIDLARDTAKELDYELVEFTNKSNNKTYYILKEKIPISKGWGTYVFNPSSQKELIIEIPHPLFEFETCEAGIDVFIKTLAKAFLLAGTHRYANADNSSDVAHNANSIFELVHEAVSTPNSSIIQIHGFSTVKHPGYPDIVLSNGTSNPLPEFTQIQDILATYSITVGIYDGINYSDLAATTNVQGQHTNSINGKFYHCELADTLREDATKISNLKDALKQLFSSQ